MPQPEKIEMNRLFSMLPPQVYHAFNGSIDIFNKKKLSYHCGCGKVHSVLDSYALVDTGLTNIAIYLCPENDCIFNVIKATGVFRIKGLENRGYLNVKDEADKNVVLMELERRKRRS